MSIALICRTCTPQFTSASKIYLFPATITVLKKKNNNLLEEIYPLMSSLGSGIVLKATTQQYNCGANGGRACFLLSYLP